MTPKMIPRGIQNRLKIDENLYLVTKAPHWVAQRAPGRQNGVPRVLKWRPREPKGHPRVSKRSLQVSQEAGLCAKSDPVQQSANPASSTDPADPANPQSPVHGRGRRQGRSLRIILIKNGNLNADSVFNVEL